MKNGDAFPPAVFMSKSITLNDSAILVKLPAFTYASSLLSSAEAVHR